MAPRPQRRQGGRPLPPTWQQKRAGNRSANQKFILDYVPKAPKGPRAAPQVKPVAPIGPYRAPKGQALGLPEREQARRLGDEASQTALEAAQSGDDSLLLPYQPTPSINPPRPRTRAAGYDAETRTLRVRFRDGTVYGYYDVPPNVWRNFKRVKSPGRAVNRTLNNYSYAREDDL